MMNERSFCVLSSNFTYRKRIIERIKTDIFKGNISSLNTIVIYSQGINLEKLKEQIYTYSFENKRVFLFKQTQDLPQEIKSFLLKTLKEIASVNYIIFEIEREYSEFVKDAKVIRDKFYSYLLKVSKVIKTQSFKEDISLRKLIFAVRRRQAAQTLYILEKLFLEFKNSDVLGMQILGALIKEFSFIPDSLTKQNYFRRIWETDRLIKEKGVDPKLALEILIAKILLPSADAA